MSSLNFWPPMEVLLLHGRHTNASPDGPFVYETSKDKSSLIHRCLNYGTTSQTSVLFVPAHKLTPMVLTQTQKMARDARSTWKAS